MILMFFAAIIGVFSINLMSISISFQGLNRAVINAPIEAMYKSLVINDEKIKFDTNKLMSVMDDYYEKSVSRYCESFVTLYFFYGDGGIGYCLEDYCLSFDVTIIAKLIMNLNFQRTMSYKIGGANNG